MGTNKTPLQLNADILKVNYFERSQFSLVRFCAELCTEMTRKHIRFEKKTCKLCTKYEKVPVFQVLRSKVKSMRIFKKIVCGHASVCSFVLETLAKWSASKSCSIWETVQPLECVQITAQISLHSTTDLFHCILPFIQLYHCAALYQFPLLLHSQYFELIYCNLSWLT